MFFSRFVKLKNYVFADICLQKLETLGPLSGLGLFKLERNTITSMVSVDIFQRCGLQSDIWKYQLACSHMRTAWSTSGNNPPVTQGICQTSYKNVHMFTKASYSLRNISSSSTSSVSTWISPSFWSSCKNMHSLPLTHPKLLPSYLQLTLCLFVHSLFLQKIPTLWFSQSSLGWLKTHSGPAVHYPLL